jgi:hypothetical protein
MSKRREVAAHKSSYKIELIYRNTDLHHRNTKPEPQENEVGTTGKRDRKQKNQYNFNHNFHRNSLMFG